MYNFKSLFRFSLNSSWFIFFLLSSLQNQNGPNDDEDGVEDCTFTQLLSTGHCFM
ncbi:hypothetical protein Hanom_Chr14g01321221 [Helianthus anomalus]